VPLEARRRLAFALDHARLDDARRCAAAVADSVGVLKVGLELFTRAGPAAARLGAELGCETFLDLKLHDIPETVERAVAAAADLGVRYLTLHAQGGPRMLERAAERAQRSGSGLVLLGVTVLTSLDAQDLAAIGIASQPAEQVLRLGRLAARAGIGGLVCSTAEVAALRRELGPDLVLVTPGIRPAGAGDDDQKRTGTPAAAVRDGASLLVVGRPIRDAADPAAAARAIVDEIARAARARA
jgi:orotidine-5'-phosphate decarboxylase